jgi:hypothetical protein
MTCKSTCKWNFKNLKIFCRTVKFLFSVLSKTMQSVSNVLVHALLVVYISRAWPYYPLSRESRSGTQTLTIHKQTDPASQLDCHWSIRSHFRQTWIIIWRGYTCWRSFFYVTIFNHSSAYLKFYLFFLLFCSETTLTGESRFHISTPQGIEHVTLVVGSKQVSPLDQWDMVRIMWDCRLSTVPSILCSIIIFSENLAVFIKFQWLKWQVMLFSFTEILTEFILSISQIISTGWLLGTKNGDIFFCPGNIDNLGRRGKVQVKSPKEHNKNTRFTAVLLNELSGKYV